MTREKLLKTQKELEDERLARLNMCKEKDEIISELETRVKNIQIAYDSIIDISFDTFQKNMVGFKLGWEEKSAELQVKNKNLLAELGLRIHDI